MKKYYVACVSLFGLKPPIDECDEVEAATPAAAAEKILRDMNEESSPFCEIGVMAVARMDRRPLKWEYVEVTGTISYAAKAIDREAAQKVAAA